MNRVRKFVMGGAALALAAVVAANVPDRFGAGSSAPAKRPVVRGRTHAWRDLAAAPLISIALKHKAN